jgi:hypothetical protein
MTKGRVALIVGSTGAILTSGVALAIWVANGIVYGSLVGLKDRGHDLAVAHVRATIALTAAILLQVIAMFTTASWLPRMQPNRVVRTPLRFALALVISLLGAGLALVLVLQTIRMTH